MFLPIWYSGFEGRYLAGTAPVGIIENDQFHMFCLDLYRKTGTEETIT